MSNKKSPLLIVVSAPSGGGKTTLCSRLLRDFQELKLSISCTTRAPRGNEKDGVEYFFISEPVFLERIKNGDFVEWAKVHGALYGTSKTFISDTLSKGNSVLLDIDVQGAASLKKTFGDKCVTLFLAPPNLEVLEQRLRARKTDSEAKIQERLANAKVELVSAPTFDHLIVNDDLESTYVKLKTLVESFLK